MCDLQFHVGLFARNPTKAVKRAAAFGRTALLAASFSNTHAYMGFKFLLSLSTIQAIRFSRPASVFASRYARV